MGKEISLTQIEEGEMKRGYGKLLEEGEMRRGYGKLFLLFYYLFAKVPEM